MADLVGRTVHRYRIVEKLGEGGMGSVWLADDPLLHRRVAIKTLPESMASSPEAKQRFLREARAACALAHPGIATVHDAGEQDGTVFIAFELIEGETVSDRCRRSPITVQEAARLAREAAEALGHAHGREILHRDVTGRNVMVDTEGRAKIVDFGLALPSDETRITRAGSVLGTVAYLAPEAVRGEPTDRRADLYGLGVVFYEMLTGRLPFEGARPEAVLYAVAHEEAPPPSALRPGLSSDVDRLLEKALAKDPDRRYQTADELVADLRRLEGIESDRWPIPRRLVAAVAIPAAIGAALAAWWLVGRSPTELYESVAVLPLENLSAASEEVEHLSLGLGDTLATKLGKVGGLRVTPWVTSQRYPPAEIPLPEIARELNVDVLLVGSLRKRGSLLRLNLALVNAKTGLQVWSDEMQASDSDVLGITERVSVAVSKRMKGELSDTDERILASRPTEDPEAFDQYLRGAALMQVGSREASDQALVHFERAVERDPGLAAAHVGIGAIRVERYFKGWGDSENIVTAEQSFRRALEHDRSLMGAFRGLIRVAWNIGENIECLELGREVRDTGDVGVESLMAQAEAYVFGGLADEAVPLLQVINRLDPANQGSHWFLVLALAWSSNYPELIEAGERYFRRFGEDAEVHRWVGVAQLCTGNFDAAREHTERSLELYGPNAAGGVYGLAARVYLHAGYQEDAARVARLGAEVVAARLSEAQDNYRVRTRLAELYSILGDARKVREQVDWVCTHGEDTKLLVGFFRLVDAVFRIGDRARAAELLSDRSRQIRETGRASLFRADLETECPPWEFATLPEYIELLQLLEREEARLRETYAG